MSLAEFHSYWTVLVLVVFVAIVVWVFGIKRKSHYDEVSRIPLDDDVPIANTQSKGDSRDG